MCKAHVPVIIYQIIGQTFPREHPLTFNIEKRSLILKRGSRGKTAFLSDSIFGSHTCWGYSASREVRIVLLLSAYQDADQVCVFKPISH